MRSFCALRGQGFDRTHPHPTARAELAQHHIISPTAPYSVPGIPRFLPDIPAQDKANLSKEDATNFKMKFYPARYSPLLGSVFHRQVMVDLTSGVPSAAPT